MKPLNKKSWLYKLNMEYGTREFSAQSIYYNRVSLCTLMSSTMVVLLKGLLLLWFLLFLSVGGLIIIGALISPILLLSGWIPSFVDIVLLYPLLITILTIIMFFGSIMCHVGLIPFAPDYMKFKRKSSTGNKPSYSFRDSYVYNYIKALKGKLCPIIEIV
jgi:hypothetical protein